ncbi:DNA-binding protein [Mesorhizobium sp. LSHC420B00]|uniref:Arc family DNA-binding protein n=1 Tax=unclassified Mesorhizobium TaxID=325217 RepID=UPI0003CE2115|nr:Arc family DNA-binding protein [Mesorhizobium sp. LSHC420B00]ESX80233.1 DNA-binding protein [Mesorhizobium sp. LSHC420B00]
MRKRYPSETKDRFIIRLPDGMRDQINEAAKINGRTMTAEIVTRLRMSFESEGKSPSGEPVRPLEEEVAELKSQLKILTRRMNDVDTRTQHLLPAKKK